MRHVLGTSSGLIRLVASARMSPFPSVLPEPGITPLRGGPVLRWGVLAPGRIAGGFVWALHHHTDQREIGRAHV